VRIGGVYETDYPLQLLRTKLILGENETNMTAIAVVFMPEGFVIGADGLRQTTHRSVVTDKAQKIFGFQTEKTTLAYAWCGQTVFWNEDDHSQVFFDFEAATKPALTLASLMALDLNDFAENLRMTFLTLLMQSNQTNPGWVAAANAGSMARMLAVGYFNHEPFLLEIKVQQVNSLPFVSGHRFVPSNDLRAFSGHPSVAPDERLQRVPDNVEDARNLIHEYIQRCADSPECKDIGGRTHVALVSLDSFDWIDAPENSN
jgi:hypothetical protein